MPDSQLTDLEKKSIELKNLISQYEASVFLGDLSMMLNFISIENPNEQLKALSSPLRQIFYLAGLNLTSKINTSKPLTKHFTNEEWQQITKLLSEIEIGYLHHFYPKESQELSEDLKKKIMVAMPTFLGYFNLGPLNYEEQVIERVSTYFQPFNNQIKAALGIGVQDFIDIYNFIDSLPNKFFDEKFNKHKGERPWKEFATEMIEKNVHPENWIDYMPQGYKNILEFLPDPGVTNRFSGEQLSNQFGKEKASAFLKVLTCERKETSFLYYTESNILFTKPIFKIALILTKFLK